MVRVDCSPIGTDVDELSQFLEEKLHLKLAVEGSNIVVGSEEGEDVKTNIVKTYLKRFLHAKGLRHKYRLSVHAKNIMLIPTGEEEES